MTVTGFYFVYGVEVDLEDLKILLNEGLVNKQNGYEEEEEAGEKWMYGTSEGRACQLVHVPHEARGTDYEGGESFFGLVNEVGFGSYSYDHYDDLEFDHQFEEDTRHFIHKMFPNKKFEYQIIPNDCNCCS